ncbi:hypothetical protein KI387_006074, partial [Taxus chinensis]
MTKSSSAQHFGQLGQKYARDADRPVWRKSVHVSWFREICPRQSRTVATRVRGGRKPAGSAETEDFCLGHLGQKYAWDVKSRRSREQMKSCHVSSSQRATGKPESGGLEKFVPGSLGHSGQEYARDAKSQKSHQRIRTCHVSE